MSPILAPLAGSGVIAVAGWRAVFACVAVAAVACMVMVYRSLAETRGPERRVESGLGSALRAYWLLLRRCPLSGSGGHLQWGDGGLFVFVAGSPFVFINHYGFSPTQYSLAFSFNAVAFISASQFTAPLGKRFGLVPLVKDFAATTSGAFMLYAAVFPVRWRQVGVLTLFFIASGFMGFVIPSASVAALVRHGAIAGTASALMGTLQMMGGALAMGIVSLFANGKPLPMVAGMAAGSLTGVTLTWLTLGRKPLSRQPTHQALSDAPGVWRGVQGGVPPPRLPWVFDPATLCRCAV
ncbi:MAG: MFS transporter [Burkholderiaceae bacterium]